MRKVWWAADSIVSPLGLTSHENFKRVLNGDSGAAVSTEFGNKSVCLSQFNYTSKPKTQTNFEYICEKALTQLRKQIQIPTNKTLFILSTTKGNIEVLETDQTDHPRIHLHQISGYLSKSLGISKDIVVSNACTSGVVALLLAKRMIESGEYDHAVVLGADVISSFVVSGFQCLNALSDSPCKPFDAKRIGINLGEAASAVLVTTDSSLINSSEKIQLSGGSITNDANHISGPSKTGEELAKAVAETLMQSQVKTSEIDFISAHGTATLYNDEMESKAFSLAGLSETPLHSLKGNFGHTLGAAGVVESTLSIHSLLNQKLLPTKGFETLGVSKPVNIIAQPKEQNVRIALKTSSGFGGCNASILFKLY